MSPTRRDAVVRAIADARVVAIIRMPDASAVAPVVGALAEGGVRIFEVTMTVPGAADIIKRLIAELPNQFVVGAGTVLDCASTERVIGAGAQFVVSPVFLPEVINLAHTQDAAALPGCFSPSEIYSAMQAGADLVKVFPATRLGPTYVRDVLGPLPQLRLLPTGGVTIENAAEWIRAGAVAVGIGSSLLRADALAAGDFKSITDAARRLVANVATV